MPTTKFEPTAADIEAVRDQGTSDADRWRLAQAHAMLRMFREANGRDARNIEELTEWLASLN